MKAMEEMVIAAGLRSDFDKVSPDVASSATTAVIVLKTIIPLNAQTPLILKIDLGSSI